ncbi:unnamed protein product [Arctogadus glacialis]
MKKRGRKVLMEWQPCGTCKRTWEPTWEPKRQGPLQRASGKYTVNPTARARIRTLHEDLNRKGMTQQGKDRKKRVCRKVWHEETTTLLQLSVYMGVLAILKEYVMVFQGSQTLVHKLHDKQFELFLAFLACFPALSAMVKCALSIFHGPRVESSFSLMNEILDPRSGNMKISTFCAIQKVKYTLQSREKTAVELFKREDVRYGEVDRTLCKNIRSAGSTDKLQRQQNMLEKQRQQIEYGCQASGSASLSKRQEAEEEKRARLRHAAKQRKRALETLVQVKKKNK